MVLDTSAIIAAISSEPDSARFQQAMGRGEPLTISAVTVLETRIVLQSRYGAEAVGEFDHLLENAGITVVPFDSEMAAAAFEGFRQFGKGRGHPAQLNIV